MVSEGKKADQKDIVNNMVVRGDDGEWSFDLSKCSVTTRMERYNDNYTKDALVSMPYRRACTAFGGEDNLKLAVAEDEATIVVEKGVRIAKWIALGIWITCMWNTSVSTNNLWARSCFFSRIR